MTKDDIITLITEKGENPDGFVIRTKEEDATFLENFKEAEVEKALAAEVKSIYDNLDKDVYNISNIKRGDEKSFDYQKRVLRLMKQNAERVPELESEIASLKERVGKNADAKILADLENVRTEFAAFKTAKEKEVEDLRKETELSRKRAIIEAEVNSFEYDPTVKEGVLKVYRDNVINGLLQASEFRDNNLIFLDEKGNPLRNQNNTLAPYTANEIIAERLKDVIKQKRVIPGPPKPGDPKTPPKAVPDSVKNKVQLGQHLMSEGYKRGTKEYDELYSELGKDLPLE